MRRLIASLVVGMVWLACTPCARASVPPLPADDQEPAAQEPAPQQTTPAQPPQESAAASHPSVSFLTAYRFHLAAASLRSSDPRFDWDAHFGGDVDILDYEYGRINFMADYEVVLGHVIRHFDPVQGDYHLDLSTSWRIGSGEVQAIFHHTSRHLGDRANLTSVAWNTLGAKLTETRTEGPTTVSLNVRGARITQKAFVDYTWQWGGGADLQYRLSPRWALVGSGDLDLTAVNPAIAGRGTQVGGRAEAAIRVYGTGAALEAFAGVERRVDPYPLERDTRTWPLVGFRFLSR